MVDSKTFKLNATVLCASIFLLACGSSSDEQDSISQSLIINEVVAKSDSEGSDWIELKNIGLESVSTQNYSIADSEDGSESQLPVVVIEANEFLIIQASGESNVGEKYSVSFKLGSEDTVKLLYEGVEVDRLDWKEGDAKKGTSYGVYSDAHQTLYPTPSGNNIPYQLFIKDEVVEVKLNLSEENWQAILANPEAEEYQQGSMEFNGIFLDDVAIRTKGLTSLGSVSALAEDDPSAHRFSFKVDINDYVDQTFLGMKKLVFNNNWADPSMMRDVIAYELMAESGVATPRIAYVDLWVGGEHLGLYNIVEAIDGEFIESYFPEDDDDTGDLYKAEYNVSLNWIDESIHSYAGIELKNNKETLNTSLEGVALINFLDALNNSSLPDTYVDVDSLLRYFAANTMVANMDSYGGLTAHNFYLYEQRSNSNKFSMLPWDFNLAMGTMSADCDATEFFIDEPTSSDLATRPLYEKLLTNNQYLAQYHEYLQQLINGPFSIDNMNEKIDRIADLIDPYVRSDTTKFFSYEQWRTALVSDIDISDIEVVVSPQGIPAGMLPEGFDPALCPDIDFSQGIPSENLSSCFHEGYFPPIGGQPSPPQGSSEFTLAPGLKSWIAKKVLNVQQQLNGELPSSNNGHGVCLVEDEVLPENLVIPEGFDFSCLPEGFNPATDTPPEICFSN